MVAIAVTTEYSPLLALSSRYLTVALLDSVTPECSYISYYDRIILLILNVIIYNNSFF